MFNQITDPWSSRVWFDIAGCGTGLGDNLVMGYSSGNSSPRDLVGGARYAVTRVIRIQFRWPTIDRARRARI